MVKFGHQLAEGIEQNCEESVLQEPLHYKDLKKLLKLYREHAVDQPDAYLATIAPSMLTSPWWDWSVDAAGLENASDTEFVTKLFERKLEGEIPRLHTNMNTIRDIIQSNLQASGRLQHEIRSHTSGVDSPLRRSLQVRERTSNLQTQLGHYADLNYIAFYKIIKKFNKVIGMEDNSLMERILPQVDEQIKVAISYERSGSVDKKCSKAANAPDNLDDLDKSTKKLVKKMNKQQSRLVHELTMELDKNSDASQEDQSEISCGTLCKALVAKCEPPLVSALGSDYGSQGFAADLTAAIIIAIAGIPKALAYANLTGLPIAAGIATLYMPCLIYGIIGGSRQIAISPQSVTCLLLAGVIDQAVAGTEFEDDVTERMALAMTYTMFTGMIMAAFGALNLGVLLNFISKSVLSGFVSASAIIAAAATVKNLLLINAKKSPILYELVMRIIKALPGTQLQTASISAFGIFMMFTMAPMQKKILGRLRNVNGLWAKPVRAVLKVPTVLYLVAVGILIGGQLCSFVTFSFIPHQHVVVGRGATSTALLYNKAAEAFNCDHMWADHVSMEYVATGSGDGLQSVLIDSPVSDFAGSDVLPTQAELTKSGVVAFPLTRSFVCPFANIPLIRNAAYSSLVLDVPTLEAIFSGSITRWTDPRIRALNPNLAWDSVSADEQVRVVVRKGSSGTTLIFSQALADSNVTSSIKPGLDVEWGAPLITEAKGNKGVIEYVSENQWTIGYATYNADSAADDHYTTGACVAIKTGSTVVSASLSWARPSEFAFPIQHVSYMLVPLEGEVTAGAKHDVPRLESCEARRWLHSYAAELYDSGDAARELYMSLEARPESLDKLLCPSHRRLNSLERRLAIKQSKCAAGVPMCSDVKMVGYIKPAFLNFLMPAPKTPLPLGGIFMNCILLACVALLEHVANAKLYAERGNYKISMSGDLVAVGASNVIGAMFGSFLVAGGFSRSALNAGAKSQLSMLLSVPISLAAVYGIAPLLSLLPMAILNVIVFMAVIHLVEWKLVVQLVRLGRCGLKDLVELTIAFVATCFLGVVPGMITAVAMSLAVFMFNSTYPQIYELQRSRGTVNYEKVVPRKDKTICCVPLERSSAGKSTPIKVVRFEAPMWFANIARLVDRLASELKGDFLMGIVLDMSSVPWIDVTATSAISKLLKRAEGFEVPIVFAAANSDTSGMIRATCGDNSLFFFDTIYDAELAIESQRLHLHAQVSTAELAKSAIKSSSRKAQEAPKLELDSLEIVISSEEGRVNEFGQDELVKPDATDGTVEVPCGALAFSSDVPLNDDDGEFFTISV